MNIQDRINSLQPYVLQIRFVEGLSVVDAVFKEGWKVPTSTAIQAVQGEDPSTNYYMIYTEKEDLGLDDVFDFVEHIIEVNIEREKKYELLKIKTQELKELFKKNSLSKLENMKFVLGNELLVPDRMPDDFDDEVTISDIDNEEETVNSISNDEPSNGVEIDEHKLEVVKEVKPIVEKIGAQEVELPPKGQKIELEEFDEPNIVCKCKDGEVCPICTDY